LVTFEQIDPLFTLDLSNPRNPRVIGELKIPGFSSYLHPLDDDHLLAIGVDLPEPGPDGRVDWSQRAMKLTIFDVSNFSQPREKFTQLIGTAYGWSEAAWDHKAFNYFAARKMLAIPFSDFRPGTNGDDYWNEFVSDLRMFHIDVNTGITPRGSVSMNDVYRTYNYRDWTWRWSPWVRRSVMADDFAYAISDAGIRAINMNQPNQTTSTVLFDGVSSGR
ncbi:MAG: beta-propeller domain-containing protein, partial [Myxococcota bacterium]